MAKRASSESRQPTSGRERGTRSLDAEQVARAVISRAAEDVDLACRFLEVVGVIPVERKRLKDPMPLPLSLLLKVASYVRLLRWERAGQINDIPGLPAAQDVLDDVLTVPSAGESRLDAETLAGDVFGAWFRRMSWHGPAPAADVVLRGNDPQAVLDELAQLLWNFRELINKEN